MEAIQYGRKLAHASPKSYANDLAEYLDSVAGTNTNPARCTHILNMQANKGFLDQPAVYHKVQGDSVPKRSSGAWGSRGMHLVIYTAGREE
jgi:hypothetical protein